MILHSIENYCTLTQCNLILLCILQFSSYIREYKKVIDMTWESGTTAIGLRVCVCASWLSTVWRAARCSLSSTGPGVGRGG